MNDTPASHSDVLDAFRKLDWRHFEDFLFELVRSRGFTNLEREVVVGGMQLDLVAMEQNALLGKPIKWAFDAKARKERLPVMDVQQLGYLKTGSSAESVGSFPTSN